MPQILIPLRPILGVLQIGIKSQGYREPDSEHSTVTYTSASEDDLYMGSPGVEIMCLPEEQSRHHFTYFNNLYSEPVYPSSYPSGRCADYPADRGDDDDDAEDEHLAPAEPAAVAYSADQDPYIAYRVAARMSIRTQAPTPFLSEEVAERVLALPTPPPSPLSPYSSPLPQIPSPPLPIPPPSPISPTYVEGSLGSRAAGIRQRDALPSQIHETEIPEMWLPLRKRLCRTTPGPGCEVGESSAAGAARQFGPTTADADLYGFTDIIPGDKNDHLEGVQPESFELSSTVDQEDEIHIFSIWMMHGEARLSMVVILCDLGTVRWMPDDQEESVGGIGDLQIAESRCRGKGS
ncbi:hypothetical protein Tco_0155536 [Tanacetum coccineum]